MQIQVNLHLAYILMLTVVFNKMDEFMSRIANSQPDIIAVTEVLLKHSHDKIKSVNVQ